MNATPVLSLCNALVLVAGLACTVSRGQVLPPMMQDCGTVVSPEQVAAELRRMAEGIDSHIYPRVHTCIGLTFHVVRANKLSKGIDRETLGKALLLLNREFAPMDISFAQIGHVRYINDKDFTDTSGSEIDALRAKDVVDGTINCYFVESLEGGALRGISSFSHDPVQGIIYANDQVAASTNMSTVPHEMAHYFNLFHTHEVALTAVECTDGSNSTTAGDLIDDTAADPDIKGRVDSSCVWIGVETPPCGLLPYDPPVFNFMSSSVPTCRTEFTPHQQDRILATLATDRQELHRNQCDVCGGLEQVRHDFFWRAKEPPPARPARQISFSYDWKTRDRTRRCKQKDKDNNTLAWAPAPMTLNFGGTTFAPNSTSRTCAQVEVDQVLGGGSSIDGFVNMGFSVDPQLTGCSKGKWRKSAMARARSMAQAHFSGRGSSNGNFTWFGSFFNQNGNTVTVKKGDRKVLKDPIRCTLIDHTTGVVTRQTLLNIRSVVGNSGGGTQWSGGDNVRFLTNTAPDMTFEAQLGDPAIVSPSGRLYIVVEGGTVTQLEQTGYFAGIVGLPGKGASGNFSVIFPAISFSYDMGGNPGHDLEWSIDMGGAAHETGLPGGNAFGECTLLTDLAAGADEHDISSPLDGDATLGFEGSRALAHVADDFEVPPGGDMWLDSVLWPVYQENALNIEDEPTISSAYVRIWKGATPQTSVLVAGDIITNRLVEADEDAGIYRVPLHTPADDSRRIQEAFIDLTWVPQLSPGRYWIEVAFDGDPSLGGVGVPPCPWKSGLENGYTFDSASGTWTPARDAATGRPLDFSFALFGDDQPPPCPADFDGSGFVDVFDYDEFVRSFEAGEVEADIDLSGFVDTDDFDAFVHAFEGGC